MLTMHLVGMAGDVFRVHSAKPREENSKRIALVCGFFSHPEAAQVLRRSSLVLQLSSAVEAVTATTRCRAEEEPVMVKLVKGGAQDVVVSRLRRIIGAMHLDPGLDLGPAICVLLATAVDLVVRFNMYLEYPFRLARLCRVWFPSFWYHYVFEFLHEREENLDVGVGLQLQRLAWAKGSETAALAWLSSAPIQFFMQQICEEALSTSLPCERRLGEVKQWETSRSTNIATASRNMIAVRFAKQREQLSNELAVATRKLRRARMYSVTSYKWEADLASRPRGVPWSESNQGRRVDTRKSKTRARSAHVSGARDQGAAAAHASGARTRARSAHVSGARDQGAVAAHASAARTPQSREFAARRQEMLRAAEAEVQTVASRSDLPITRAQWSQWLESNIDEFRERMKTALARRRLGNFRLRARAGLPAPAQRLRPKSEKKSVPHNGLPTCRGAAAGMDSRTLIRR